MYKMQNQTFYAQFWGHEVFKLMFNWYYIYYRYIHTYILFIIYIDEEKGQIILRTRFGCQYENHKRCLLM